MWHRCYTVVNLRGQNCVVTTLSSATGTPTIIVCVEWNKKVCRSSTIQKTIFLMEKDAEKVQFDLKLHLPTLVGFKSL